MREPAIWVTRARRIEHSGGVIDDYPAEQIGLHGSVVAVHRNGDHSFTKATTNVVRLVAGLGVEGDAHFGARVKHRSRVKADPEKPNLRQVHLIHGELFEELRSAGFHVRPGDLGENITTSGVDLLNLPVGTTLRLGSEALIAITGLRNPCKQIDGFQSGLLSEVLRRTGSGELVRKAGVMAVVIQSGDVRTSDEIWISIPPPPHRLLDRV